MHIHMWVGCMWHVGVSVHAVFLCMNLPWRVCMSVCCVGVWCAICLYMLVCSTNVIHGHICSGMFCVCSCIVHLCMACEALFCIVNLVCGVCTYVHVLCMNVNATGMWYVSASWCGCDVCIGIYLACGIWQVWYVLPCICVLVMWGLACAVYVHKRAWLRVCDICWCGVCVCMYIVTWTCVVCAVYLEAICGVWMLCFYIC